MTSTSPTELRGILTALATPFDADEKIDTAVLKQLVDRSVDNGVDGVVVGGSTAEVAALSADERLQLVEDVIEYTAGRVPVVAQTGATSTAEAIRHSRAAQSAGADVLMLVTPYYEPLSLDETLTYIREVSSSVDIPVMLYNIPDATGVNLDADTAGSLAGEIDNIRYIKDSGADWEQALRLIHHHSDKLGTFIGWDPYLYSALAEGAAGAVAGAANVVPSELVSVSRLIAEDKLVEARTEWNRVYPAIDAMISENFIAAVKAGLRHNGISAGVPRRPVADVPADATDRITAALDALQR